MNVGHGTTTRFVRRGGWRYVALAGAMIAVVAAWGWSVDPECAYWRADSRQHLAVGLERGALWVGCTGTLRAAYYVANLKSMSWWYRDMQGPVVLPEIHEFFAGRAVGLPLWPSIPIAIVAIMQIISRSPLWKRRTRSGFCKCGYDLTGNVSGRCPECGTPVDAVKSAADGSRAFEPGPEGRQRLAGGVSPQFAERCNRSPGGAEERWPEAGASVAPPGL